MQKIPIHKSSLISNCGIHIKSVTQKTEIQPKTYSHADEYYTFGIINEGECLLNIDFKDCRFGSGDMVIIRAGQVHRFVHCSCLSAYMLAIDEIFLNDMEKQTLERNAGQGLHLPDMTEIRQLYSLLAGKAETQLAGKTVMQRYAMLIVALVIEHIAARPETSMTHTRHEQIVWIFRKLLKDNIRSCRLPSFYAERMHISVAYLNEAVKAVTGKSTGAFIRDEIILAAKRQLAYTDSSVKEIAHGLGFDDYSYFTRLFTKATGDSPTNFRKIYRG
ncbi:MAG: AraC family transcriptional regulator [Bacteroidales bacterium]|nr:AraC family transcriptional regulator [Bacteroidales bacterium]